MVKLFGPSSKSESTRADFHLTVHVHDLLTLNYNESDLPVKKINRCFEYLCQMKPKNVILANEEICSAFFYFLF